MRVVSPIDPLEEKRYVESVYSEGQGDYLDHIYNIISLKDDYVNPTMDGNLIWMSNSSCKLYSGEALENWKNRLHEHLNQCHTTFAEYLRQKWAHHFIHTLEMTPRSWYTSMELRQGTQDWDEVVKQFAHTFAFSDE